MGSAALVLLLVTVAAGTMVLGFWSDAERRAGDRRSRLLVATHVPFAAATVAALVAFLIGRSTAVGAAAAGLLGATLLLGLSGFVSSTAHERRTVDGPDPVPFAMLVVHGGLAVAALAATVLAVSR